MESQTIPSHRNGPTGAIDRICREMKRHAPFTLAGTLTGVLIMGVFWATNAPPGISRAFFWTFHPLHVALSAVVTTAVFRRYGRHGFITTLLIGYTGSVGIATISDSIIPFLGEWMLALPNRGIHLGFIEKWWLVNPLAVVGIAGGYFWSGTRFPHFGHVLLSTWASLFHITMAMGSTWSIGTAMIVTVFLFLAVWLPCCFSDIVYPLLFAQGDGGRDKPEN